MDVSNSSNLNLCNNVTTSLKNNVIKIGFLNINHLLPKVDQLQDILYESDEFFSIFALNETFLNETVQDFEICIPGYHVIRRDRKDRQGGGVAVYIKSNISFIRHTNLETDRIEAIWFEIILTHIKNLMCCVLYRPPDSGTEWYDHFHEMIAVPCNNFSDLVIIGDFNLNLLGGNNSRWLLDLEMYNLKQIIKVPTRETNSSSTLVDHIYTTRVSRIGNVKVPHLKLSDHYPLYFTWKHFTSHQPRSKKGGHEVMKYRETKKLDINAFKRDLRNCPWQSVLQEADTDLSLEKWVNIFLIIVNKHAPVREKKS